MAAVRVINDLGSGMLSINGKPYNKEWLMVFYDNTTGVNANCIDIVYFTRPNGDKVISNAHYSDIELDGVACTSYTQLTNYIQAKFTPPTGGGGGGGGGDASAANQSAQITAANTANSKLQSIDNHVVAGNGYLANIDGQTSGANGFLSDIKNNGTSANTYLNNIYTAINSSIYNLLLSDLRHFSIVRYTWDAGQTQTRPVNTLVVGAIAKVDGYQFNAVDMGITSGGFNEPIFKTEELVAIVRNSVEHINRPLLTAITATASWKNTTAMDAYLLVAVQI